MPQAGFRSIVQKIKEDTAEGGNIRDFGGQGDLIVHLDALLCRNYFLAVKDCIDEAVRTAGAETDLLKVLSQLLITAEGFAEASVLQVGVQLRQVSHDFLLEGLGV